MENRLVTAAHKRAPLYHGWFVVAAAFFVAMYGFGLGFYGPGIYLAALNARHGWSTAELSSAITVYYVLGALWLFFYVGPWFDRRGARTMVALGTVAMACGAVLLASVTRLWQVYPAFVVMSFGWATMSGAAVNIIVAPWFDRRRGVAVSWGLNGGSAGGVVIAPLLTVLVARIGLAVAVAAVAASMLAILVPITLRVLRPRRADEQDWADADGNRTPAGVGPAAAPEFRLAAVLRSRTLMTISLPFALGLTAQVGFLTHQIAFLSPRIGTVAAGSAVSLTTCAAVIGRVATGFVVDRLDCRAVAGANFVVQAIGVAILTRATGHTALYLGCLLFGLGLGNTTSLPGLIVQQEFPKQHFTRVVSLVVAVNQFSFAFGPTLLGQLQQVRGSYTVGLFACLAMQLAAATIVVLPALPRYLRRRGSGRGGMGPASPADPLGRPPG